MPLCARYAIAVGLVGGAFLLTPSSAFACGKGREVSRHHSNRRMCSLKDSLPCPTMPGQSVSAQETFFIEKGARHVDYTLTKTSAPCPGATVTKTFNPDAASPRPPPHEQAAVLNLTFKIAENENVVPQERFFFTYNVFFTIR